MKEYIDLAEAKSKAVYMHGFGQAKFVSVANLEKCKAADVVERKRGEWIAKEIMIRSPHAKNYYCSVCFEHTASCSNFCPNCGADMRGENHVRED